MPVLGLNFDKLAVERKKTTTQNVNIKTSMGIKDVKKEEIPMGKKKESILRLFFEFGVEYEPKVANIDIEGNLIYTDDAKKLDAIIKDWKKNKKLDDELMGRVMNAIFLKCSIKSLLLSQEINLPPSVRLPMLKAPQMDASKYIG